MACCTVVIFSASSSGISVPNSSSSAITSSTVSSESAPRSSTNEDSFLISASFTPSCSATIFLTRCSTLSIHLLLPCEGGVKKRPYSTRRPCAYAVLHSIHEHAAIDVQRDARDVAGALGSEIGDGLRAAEATERNAREQLRLLLLREHARHVGVDEARRDAVDGDVAAADLER